MEGAEVCLHSRSSDFRGGEKAFHNLIRILNNHIRYFKYLIILFVRYTSIKLEAQKGEKNLSANQLRK